MIIPSECGFGMLYRLIVTVSSLSDSVSFTSTILAGFGCCASASGDSLCSAWNIFSKNGRAWAGITISAPSATIGPGAAGVVHVVMGQHQLLDRFARILSIGRVDDPARLPFADRSVEDHDPVLHRDDQAVVGAADHVLHVRRKLGEL